MKFTFYIIFSLLASIGIGLIPGDQLRKEPVKIYFTPAYNVTIGAANIIAAYPEAGIDFTLNHKDGRLSIGTDAGLRIENADVFRLDNVTWTAVMRSGDWVTVNAERGQTEVYLNGEYKCWTRETSKP